MKHFQFALETLLRMRRHAEERISQEFADQQRRVEEQKRKIEDMNQSRMEAENRERAAVQPSACVDLVMEQACDEYVRRLGESIRRAQAELDAMLAELERQRNVLIQAQREVKILEKLRERRYAEYLKTARRLEQGFLDEIGISHYQAQRQV